MARVTARNTHVQVLDGGTVQNISGRSNSVTMSFTAPNVQVTAFGADYHERIADGIKDWELSISGFWDGAGSSVDEVLYSLLGACTSLCYGPSGSTSGCVQYSGCAICTEFSVEGEVEGGVQWSATFVAASTLTRGTY